MKKKKGRGWWTKLGASGWSSGRTKKCVGSYARAQYCNSRAQSPTAQSVPEHHARSTIIHTFSTGRGVAVYADSTK
eukprot:3811875-Rhodomonas_salina.1